MQVIDDVVRGVQSMKHEAKENRKRAIGGGENLLKLNVHQ